MKSIKTNQYRIFIVSAFLWLTIDLVSKFIVKTTTCCSAVFINNFFYLTSQSNRGIAFGIPLAFSFQIISSIVILSMLIYVGIKYILPEKRNSLLNQFLLGIIVGGALGNLINRIALGYVIDFIVIKPFPVFNFADIGITIGLIILFLLSLETLKKT